MNGKKFVNIKILVDSKNYRGKVRKFRKDKKKIFLFFSFMFYSFLIYFYKGKENIRCFYL